MTTPLVSVIMPTRNRVDLMQRALESVSAQSVTDWELLVIDDASTDNTRSVLERRASLDSRIRPLAMPAQSGAAVARNRGLAAARGELVSFIDDDDEWLESKLELHAAMFADNGMDLGVVHGPFIEVHADGFERVAGTYSAVERRALNDLLSGNQLGHSSVTARTSAVKRVGGFDERLPRLQDWDLWIRLAAITDFANVASPLARVHITPGSISTQSDALRNACAIMVDKYPRAADLTRVQHAELCYALGQLLIRHGLGEDGRRLVRRSLRLHPWPPSRIIGGLLSQVGQRTYLALAVPYARLTALRGRTSATGSPAASSKTRA